MANKLDKDEELEQQEREAEEGLNGASSDASSGETGSSKDDGKIEKTFTQAQVTRMMTREKNQGRNAVFNELGIDPNDKKMVEMFKAFVNSQKTDEQKAQEQKNADNAAKIEAEQKAALAEAKVEAMMSGVKPQFVEDAVTLILAKTNGENDFKTAIGELKTKYPVWFGEDKSGDDKKQELEDKKSKTGQKGTGSSVKRQDKDDKSKDKPGGLGSRLAAQRKSSSGKKSYWG